MRIIMSRQNDPYRHIMKQIIKDAGLSEKVLYNGIQVDLDGDPYLFLITILSTGDTISIPFMNPYSSRRMIVRLIKRKIASALRKRGLKGKLW